MSINGTQSVRFEKWAIEFKTSFKQISVPFKVYADFECNLKSVESSEGSFSKKTSRSHSLLTNLFVLMINSENQMLLLKVKIWS